MKRCAVAVTFLALGLAGCGTQGVGTSASVGQREANGEPTMGAGDELGWSLYNSDRSIAQAKAAETAERERALASHPE